MAGNGEGTVQNRRFAYVLLSRKADNDIIAAMTYCTYVVVLIRCDTSTKSAESNINV